MRERGIRTPASTADEEIVNVIPRKRDLGLAIRANNATTEKPFPSAYNPQ